MLPLAGERKNSLFFAGNHMANALVVYLTLIYLLYERFANIGIFKRDSSVKL